MFIQENRDLMLATFGKRVSECEQASIGFMNSLQRWIAVDATVASELGGGDTDNNENAAAASDKSLIQHR